MNAAAWDEVKTKRPRGAPPIASKKQMGGLDFSRYAVLGDDYDEDGKEEEESTPKEVVMSKEAKDEVSRLVDEKVTHVFPTSSI